MKDTEQLYRGYRFAPEIVSHTVWLYHRFCLSLRPVDQDVDTIDILVQIRRNKLAAKRVFYKLLKGLREAPRRMVTDKLKSYSAAHREVMPSVTHSIEKYENNRAEVSHEPPRQRERQMRRFKSAGEAQRFDQGDHDQLNDQG